MQNYNDFKTAGYRYMNIEKRYCKCQQKQIKKINSTEKKNYPPFDIGCGCFVRMYLGD